MQQGSYLWCICCGQDRELERLASRAAALQEQLDLARQDREEREREHRNLEARYAGRPHEY